MTCSTCGAHRCAKAHTKRRDTMTVSTGANVWVERDMLVEELRAKNIELHEGIAFLDETISDKQARIDAALALLDGLEDDLFLRHGEIAAVRAALKGETT